MKNENRTGFGFSVFMKRMSDLEHNLDFRFSKNWFFELYFPYTK